MDNNSKRQKILKVVSVALPIVLVAILGVTLALAFKLSSELSSLPAYNEIDNTTSSDSASSTTTSATEKKEEEKPVEDFYTKGLKYESLGNGTCRLSGLGDVTDSYIIVPQMNENGDVVVGVSNNAFKNNNTLKGIEFPATIISIGDYSFYGSSVKEIEIGERIEKIGSYAFSACRNLENIKVSEDNAFYRSVGGVLYNKQLSELITYPAGRSENFCAIPQTVEKISNMAFYYCSNIKKVNYYGTEAQWSMIDIGAGNDVVEDAILFCTGSDGK